jgi:hypothetical protein
MEGNPDLATGNYTDGNMVGLENGVGLMGLTSPSHGRGGPARASFGEWHRGSFVSSPSLFHYFLSLPQEIRPPSTAFGEKPEKSTKSNLKNSFLMPKIHF